MSPKQAYSRYMRVFVPAMTIYAISVFTAVYLIKNEILASPQSYIVALIPGLAAMTFMWAHFRFIRETDEFHRKVQTEAMMIGIAALMAVAMTWGMMSMFTDFPELPFFYAIPIFYASYGVAAAYLGRKYKASCVLL
ncbi:hypothetical protein [Robiginitomaculum antarcticum]|uniref:hypothetical protein n=1 Tax=Robiginitomaculum antarcticum TaxID=437507 RepID=UPI0003A9A093|nr:hypothetical protein [Robiginitomaculum antarcticum]